MEKLQKITSLLTIILFAASISIAAPQAYAAFDEEDESNDTIEEEDISENDSDFADEEYEYETTFGNSTANNDTPSPTTPKTTPNDSADTANNITPSSTSNEDNVPATDSVDTDIDQAEENDDANTSQANAISSQENTTNSEPKESILSSFAKAIGDQITALWQSIRG